VDGSIFGVANGFRIALVVDRQTLEEAIKRIEMLSAKHMKVPVVKQTEEGPVQGFLALDGNVDVFLGIPYARAPVGDQLRLEVRLEVGQRLILKIMCKTNSNTNINHFRNPSQPSPVMKCGRRGNMARVATSTQPQTG
jgi:hypothetical protein